MFYKNKDKQILETIVSTEFVQQFYLADNYELYSVTKLGLILYLYLQI